MRFLAVALVLLLSIISLSCADAAPSMPSSQLVPAADAPPPVPGSQNVFSIKAIFENGTPVSAQSIMLVARSNGSAAMHRTITDPSGNIIIALNPGTYEMDTVVDLSSTPGMDFASTTTLQVPLPANATIILYPAGSVVGRVLENGAPVAFARVRVSCQSSAFDYDRLNGDATAQAGEAGDFLFSALPAGTCVVSASDDSMAGSVEVQVSGGQTAAISIDITRKAGGIDLLLAAAAVALAIIAAAFFFARLRKNQESHAKLHDSVEAHGSPSLQKQEREAGPDSEKAKAVLSTLSEREREIVKFLLACGGRAKRSQMQHKLLIPKTSLLRNLRSLERKNIVKLTPFGRNLLAELESSLFN